MSTEWDRICDLVEKVSTINYNLQILATQVKDLNAKVTKLEQQVK